MPETFPIRHFLTHSLALPPLTQEIWMVENPPAELFIQGSDQALDLLSRIPDFGLAVVGTRDPQTRSLSLVRRTIAELRGTPLIILSGFARGVDTCAHETALQFGLPTIAVLAGGCDQPYPRENEFLKQKILNAHGLIISEFAPGTEPRPHFFLQRNRLIAGWAKATWVVEASYRSGALNTAYWAREHQRLCFATPCFPSDPVYCGNQVLIDRDHALPLWGTHSLGAAWLDLSSHSPLRVLKSPLRPYPTPTKKNLSPLDAAPFSCSPFDEKMIEAIRGATFEKGGILPTELAEKLIRAGDISFTTEVYFASLEKIIRAGLVFEENGTLLSP